MTEGTRRASPLPVEDRRAMIIEAVIPLLIEHGRGVTSRQIAESAGIAEGTIFRAFGDKESLVQAAIEKYLDPVVMREGLEAIDAGLPLAVKIRRIIELMQSRFQYIMGFMAALGEVGRPPASNTRKQFAEFIDEILQPNLDRLNVPPTQVAQYIRLVAFASSITEFNRGHEFDAETLTSLIMNGIAGQPSHAVLEPQETHAS